MCAYVCIGIEYHWRGPPELAKVLPLRKLSSGYRWDTSKFESYSCISYLEYITYAKCVINLYVVFLKCTEPLSHFLVNI